MHIQVLPCVLAYIDGVCGDRIIGFEGIGDQSDNVSTLDLEARLLQANVLEAPKIRKKTKLEQRQSLAKRHVTEEDDDEDDWD